MAPLQAIGPPSASKRKSSIGALSAAAILLLVIAAGSLGWAVWQLRADARRDAFEETGNLALVLAGQLSRFLQTIGVVVGGAHDGGLNVEREDGKAGGGFAAPPTKEKKIKGQHPRPPHTLN